jgi:hypothetical protein
MGAFAFGADAANDSVVRLHRERGVRYAVAVVFPDLVSRWYRFDFRGGRCDLSGDAPYESAGVVHRIAASALAGWIEHRKSFFYVRAYSRRFMTLYELERKGESVRLRPLAPPDLLMH